MITAEKMTRHFNYGKIELPDPNPDLSPVEVRDFYAATYPELNNAHTEGPVSQGSRQVYNFAVSFGSKG